jgi:hypothetical protein
MLRRTSLPLLTLAIGLALAPSASAQATRTWVSGVGDDVNPCSRTAPCKTLAGAISKTAEYGEINAIDPGGFGAVTITKSITIDLTPYEGGVLINGGNGINVAAQPDDIVTLRGLDIHGAGPAPSGCNTGSGVRITSAKSVRIEDSRISQQQRAIWAQPTSAVDLFVNRVAMGHNCTAGIALEPGSGGSVRATVANSSIAYSGTALRAASGATAWLGNTDVFGNALGVEAVDGGTITDWGDNRFAGNSEDGAPTTKLGEAVPGPAGPQGVAGPAGTPGAGGGVGATGPLALQVLLAKERQSSKAGRSVRVRFVTTAPASARLTVVRAGRTVATVGKRVQAGASSITWSGRSRGRKAKKGRYQLVLSVAGGGQRASAEAPLRLR